MLPDTTLKRLDAISVISKTGKKINGLYRLMENPEIWKMAYANIYVNKGAITKGTDNITLDGFSMARVEKIISELKDGSYQFTPVKRVYIPKKSGKLRPLGIPNGNDKLVQEVCRIILNEIYEPCFSKYSHGFRPNRSCHTALEQVKGVWTGTKWIIEMDIKGFFDNINHEVMLKILEKKIDDKRFIKLIASMISNGYLENWKYNATYSGTPQGGVISPILANIYLNELDSYIMELISEFNIGKYRRPNPDYIKIRERRKRISREIENAKENSDYIKVSNLMEEYKELGKELLNTAYSDFMDAGYKRLNYVRYADDFILGVIGSKQDAVEIANKIERFIVQKLKLEIAPDKFAIVHATKGVEFLGFDVRNYSGNKVSKVTSRNSSAMKRTISNRMQILIPNKKLFEFSSSHGYGDLNLHKPKSRGALTVCSDAEIITQYNTELRGFVNYYSIANSPRRKLEPLVTLARTSCAMTLAHKHRTTTTKIVKEVKRANGEWIRKIQGKEKVHEFRIYRLKTDFAAPKSKIYCDDIQTTYHLYNSRSELIQRLEAKKCEWCGKETKEVEVHHVRAMKDIKDGTDPWKRLMIARNRKTMILCTECHRLLHKGQLR